MSSGFQRQETPCADRMLPMVAPGPRLLLWRKIDKCTGSGTGGSGELGEGYPME